MGKVNMKETEYYKSGRHHEDLNKARKKCHLFKDECKHCHKSFSRGSLGKHEPTCYLNPVNLKLCGVCNKPVKNKERQTCSYACSNTLFRSGEKNGRWVQDAYRTTCFLYHKKECVICEEKNIVAVHHLDENHSNNVPSNLIPLCPTHHSYYHSKFKHLIHQRILDYINEWSLSGTWDSNPHLSAPNAQ